MIWRGGRSVDATFTQVYVSVSDDIRQGAGMASGGGFLYPRRIMGFLFLSYVRSTESDSLKLVGRLLGHLLMNWTMEEEQEGALEFRRVGVLLIQCKYTVRYIFHGFAMPKFTNRPYIRACIRCLTLNWNLKYKN